jgi:hypothetical protein
MRALRIVGVLVSCLLVPGVVAAQVHTSGPAPTVYVCTAGGQVVTVDGATGAASVLFPANFSSDGSFNDCVVGPDGWLYIAKANQIVRINPSVTTANVDDPVATLPSGAGDARGLSFNITTLYINTSSGGVYKLVGTPGLFPTPDDRLDFASGGTSSACPSTQTLPCPTLLIGLGTSGQGLAFDRLGNLDVASGNGVQQLFPTNYTTGGGLLTGGLVGPTFGIAVNTCNDVLVADVGSKSIKRRPDTLGATFANVTGLTFSGNEYPRHFQIDSSNRGYLVTTSSSLSGAKIYRFNPVGSNPIASCSSATQTLLKELKTSGSGSVPGLISTSAVGLAIGRSSHSITNTFPAGVDCKQVFNYGFHTVGITFQECFTSFDVTLTSHMSEPSQIEFTSGGLVNPLPDPPIEAMRYSPEGGFGIEYVFEHPPFEPLAPPLPVGCPSSGPGCQYLMTGSGEAYRAIYSFVSQEQIKTPGIASNSTSHTLDASVPYTDSVADDYWDLRVFGVDPPGDRGDGFGSKKVVFNAGLATACAIDGTFETPLADLNPPQMSGNNLKIAFKAVTLDTQGNPTNTPCEGGTLFVSIVRIDPLPFTVVNVTSNSNEGNLMDEQSGKYSYNLQLSTGEYTSGTYLITVWGNVLEPVTKQFIRP